MPPQTLEIPLHYWSAQLENHVSKLRRQLLDRADLWPALHEMTGLSVRTIERFAYNRPRGLNPLYSTLLALGDALDDLLKEAV